MRRRHLVPLALLTTIWLASCTEEQLTEPESPQVPAPAASVDPQDLIPGEYIVVFKDGVSNPVSVANQLADAHGLELHHTYEHAIKGFSAKVPDGAVAALQRNPSISYIEQNQYWYIDTHPNLKRSALLVSPAAVKGKPTGPAAPSNLVATATGTSTIDLTWQDNSGDETGFEIERRLGQSGTFTKIAEVGANVTSYGDGGLAENTEYCYRVRAFKPKNKNNDLYSDYSNIDCATTDAAAPTPPNAPSSLVATAVSSSQIDLSWQDNSNDEDGFNIERCTGTVASCADADYGQIDQVGANVTNYSDGGLASSTTYSYRVQAFNGAGNSGYSNEDDATTFDPPQPPDADPTNLVATAASSSTIDLTWDDNASNEDGYEIWECQGTVAACDEVGLTNYSNVDQTGANATSYTRTGLMASTTYSYMVRAFNSAGESGYSNEDDATTLDPPAGCNDNGVHDDLSDPGLWGIVKVKADQNSHWLGVRGNDPAQCGMKAWFFGLDSGVDSDHPDLNVVETVDFIGDGSGGEDGNGHGTHTAGTAAAIDGGPSGGVVGVAPGAQIHGFKVCQDSGGCPLDAIISGVDEVTARKNANPSQPMVANMSLGGGATSSIDDAVRASVSAGVVYTLSAGNGVFGACFFPADAQGSSPARVGDDDIVGSSSNGDTKRVNGAITTTSSGQTDADVNCNYGNPVTVAAPGSGIKSTWLNGGYNTISGTSMAAPHSAGAAILVLQGNQGLSPTAVESEIVADVDNWTTDDLPNADGRLDARCLGTGSTSCQGNN